MVVDLLRRSDLGDAPGLHDDDAVGHGHGLLAVMRHVDGREAEPVLQRLDLVAQLHAHLGVEVGQGLVEQEEQRIDGERPAEGDALALSAREIGDLAVFETGQPQELQHLGHAPAHRLALDAAQAQPVADVAEHGHVRPQGVGLEDHGDVALLRRERGDVLAEQADGPARGFLEAGDGAQQRGLAAAGGTEDGHELARRDGKVDAVQHRHRAVAHMQILDFDRA